ncbi:hypothetical protein Bache_2783 [Bacteroides helcogenes P 36-108]|uniref:Lipoprotein n=2 Tax=Bacteroides helcogenes TaxID=290053 RepID=E6SN73_BACT6|nr:hypothetical protein Bache_2783 [Bacteroides helcogenes P 36-108]
MKNSIVLLVILLGTMFVLQACSSEDVFPEISGKTLNKEVEISEFQVESVSDVFSSSGYTSWKDDLFRTTYVCVNSSKEFESSVYHIYADKLPSVNWDAQTLVIVMIHSRYGMEYNSCNVYSNSSKFIVDVKVNTFLTDNLCNLLVAIALDKHEVVDNDVRLQLETIGL